MPARRRADGTAKPRARRSDAVLVAAIVAAMTAMLAIGTLGLWLAGAIHGDGSEWIGGADETGRAR